jgi:hypothetical protein
VIGFAVHWNVNLPNGSAGALFARLAPAGTLGRRQQAPGQIALALPGLGELRVQGDDRPLPPRYRLPPAPNYQAAPDFNLAYYQSARTVEVSLDGVLFASGQFVGPDTGQKYEQWLAETTAPPQTGAKVMGMKAAGESTASVVAWLQAAAAPESLDDFTAQVTGRTARQLLQAYQRQGEAGLYRLAQSQSQTVEIHLFR